MKIIAHKNNLYNMTPFLNSVFENEYIEGVFFEVIMTSDGEIVIFSPISDNNVTIQTIQSSTFTQLKTDEVITLREMLGYFRGTDKKIILNIIPLIHPPLNDITAEIIANKNRDYIQTIENIINEYPSLQIFVASFDHKLVFHMKNYINSCNIGLYLYRNDLSYQDVDFYVFGSEMYDENIIHEQLKRKKTIMVCVKNGDGLANITNHKKKAKTEEEKQMLDSIYYINDYPDVFYKLFNE